MHDLVPVPDLERPEFAPYRTLRRQHEHRERGVFVAEGDKVVRRLIASPLRILSLLVTERWVKVFAPLLDGRPETVPVFVAPIEKMSAALLARAAPRRLLLALDGLSNAENIGAIVRNATAFGAGGILAGETCASPWLRRAVRSSMGNVFRIAVRESADLAADLHALRAAGVRCVAAHPHDGGTLLSAAPLSGDCCLVFGSEGDGLRPEVLAQCPDRAAIPMPPDVDSLNVVSAAAAFLYEAARQRGRA